MSITESNFVIKEKGVLKDDSFQVSNPLCMPPLYVIGVGQGKKDVTACVRSAILNQKWYHEKQRSQ